MKNEPNYINPKNPVYISYAWIEDDNDVLEICRVMLENGIDYRRDKDGLCLYKKNIAEVEKKIGDGDAVVVIVSRKYMTSLHTMNEWHNILFKGDIGRRVFVVVLEDAEISNYDKVQECRGILDEEFKKLDARYQTCVKNHQIPSRHLSEVELSAQSNLGFVDDLDYLYAFCRNYNRGSKIEVHRANGFKEIIEPLKKYVTELAEAANAKETIEELKAQIAKLQQGSGAANNEIIHEYESRIKDLEKLIYDYKEKIQDLISTLSQKDKVIKQKDARIAELQSKITELENASKKTAQQSSSSIVNDRHAPLMENNNMMLQKIDSSSSYCNVIDLGLPSGPLWADRNIGALTPEDYGSYFTWGETEPKNEGEYTWDTYKYKSETPKTLPPDHDAATANWGVEWQMPTIKQFDELIKYCEKPVWKELNGKNGMEFKSKIYEKTIFFPAVGYKYEKFDHDGFYGHYWSSSDYDVFSAWSFYFFSDLAATVNSYRKFGFSVRAVVNKN